MLNNNKWFVCAALAVAAAASGCSSNGNKKASDGSDNVQPTTSSTGSLATSGANGNGGAYGSGNGSAPSSSQSIVYFDFDSSDIKADSQAVVASWAKYLTANPTAKVQLQGNTDERGTREYNIALGERRAQSVSSALQGAGVSGSQVSLTSFGEERPVALGHDESSWSQNRRVEIVAQ